MVINKPYTLKDVRGAIIKFVHDKVARDYNDS